MIDLLMVNGQTNTDGRRYDRQQDLAPNAIGEGTPQWTDTSAVSL
jgi:hypothetical protein